MCLPSSEIRGFVSKGPKTEVALARFEPWSSTKCVSSQASASIPIRPPASRVYSIATLVRAKLPKNASSGPKPPSEVGGIENACEFTWTPATRKPGLVFTPFALGAFVCWACVVKPTGAAPDAFAPVRLAARPRRGLRHAPRLDHARHRAGLRRLRRRRGHRRDTGYPFGNLTRDPGEAEQYSFDAYAPGTGGIRPVLGARGPFAPRDPAVLALGRGLGGATGWLVIGPEREHQLVNGLLSVVASSRLFRSSR